MTQKSEYIADINSLKVEAVDDLEDLLSFSKELLSNAQFNKYIKAKTILRYNTFSALYQRAASVLELTKINQGNASNILIRSMWETLIEYDFVCLIPTNINLDIRLASESKQQLSTWNEVKRLRKEYPNSETWKKTIPDTSIDKTITRRQAEVIKFNQKHPSIKLSDYKTLISRLKIIDDHRLSIDPTHQALTQFDYRSVYSLLSHDTHSTIYGNISNTRLEPKAGLDIRLDAPIYEGVRATHVAYKLMLQFLRHINKIQNIKKGVELKTYISIDKSNDIKFQSLQDKYGF